MHWRVWSNRAVCWFIPHAVSILRKTTTRSGHFSVNTLNLNWNVPNCFCPLRIAMVHTPRISGRKIDPPLCFSFIEKEQSRICRSCRYGFTDKCFYKKNGMDHRPMVSSHFFVRSLCPAGVGWTPSASQ